MVAQQVQQFLLPGTQHQFLRRILVQYKSSFMSRRLEASSGWSAAPNLIYRRA
jgi:hypothetical protein